jgi:hypothetical protein
MGITPVPHPKNTLLQFLYNLLHPKPAWCLARPHICTIISPINKKVMKINHLAFLLFVAALLHESA